MPVDVLGVGLDPGDARVGDGAGGHGEHCRRFIGPGDLAVGAERGEDFPAGDACPAGQVQDGGVS